MLHVSRGVENAGSALGSKLGLDQRHNRVGAIRGVEVTVLAHRQAKAQIPHLLAKVIVIRNHSALLHEKAGARKGVVA